MTAGELAPETLTLTGPVSVSGTVRVPGDKSISHRALILSALAAGESRVHGLSGGDDVARTRAAVAALGAAVREDADGVLVISGGSLREPTELLDHGNSGTGIRLMAGVCAGLDMFTVLTGDRYLRRRPMRRVVGPLREMGARIDGRGGGDLAPLAIRGGRLDGITYRSPVASAQVKSSVLLAGLGADGPTTVVEPVATRRHTEEMLADFGLPVAVDGTAVTLTPGPLTPTTVRVPGDPSQAAFWAVAGIVAPDSDVLVEDLYLGSGRVGFLAVLEQMGVPVEVDRGAGSVRVSAGRPSGITVDPAAVASFIDEVPILAVVAAVAEGRTVFSGASELRVKESDRIATTVAMLTAFGVAARETADGMVIDGGGPLRGAEIDSHGDHRIAMAAAIAGLRAEGTTTIRGWEAVATSYPGFASELDRRTGGAAKIRIG